MIINDRLNGIERDSQSPLRGKVVCRHINIWKDLERTKAFNRKGKHGDDVEVLEQKFGSDGRNYYRVKVIGKFLTGWVSYPFLDKNGGKYY